MAGHRTSVSRSRACAGLQAVIAMLAFVLIACGPGGEHDACGATDRCNWQFLGAPLTVPAADLAAGPVTLTTVQLPEGSRQEQGRWYRVELALELELVSPSASSESRDLFPAYLSADAGGAVFFQLKLAPAGAPTSGARTEWSTFGLVDGPESGLVSAAGTAHIEFVNYLQTRSVRAGPVPIAIRFDGPDVQLIRRVTVLPSSRLIVTAEGPPSLEIRAERVDLTGSPQRGTAHVRLLVEVDGVAVRDASVTVVCLGRDGDASCIEEAEPPGLCFDATVPFDRSEPAPLPVYAPPGRALRLPWVERRPPGLRRPRLDVPT